MKSSKLLSAVMLLGVLSLFSTACKRAQNENQVENPAQQQQVIQALREAYSAFNRGDIDAAVKPLDEHIEWTEPDSFPGGGTYHGVEGAHRYLAQSRAGIAEGSSEPEKFIVAGNRIVVFVRANVRPKGSNEWVDLRIADVYTVRKGKAIDMHAFSDRQEALRWAGAVEVNQLIPDLDPEQPKTSSEVAAESTGYPRKAPSFSAGWKERMRYAVLSLQGPQPKFLYWNTKFVEYPRAGEARIGCEVSPARMGPRAGTRRGTLSLSPGGI